MSFESCFSWVESCCSKIKEVQYIHVHVNQCWAAWGHRLRCGLHLQQDNTRGWVHRTSWDMLIKITHYYCQIANAASCLNRLSIYIWVIFEGLNNNYKVQLQLQCDILHSGSSYCLLCFIYTQCHDIHQCLCNNPDLQRWVSVGCSGRSVWKNEQGPSLFPAFLPLVERPLRSSCHT